MPSATCTPRPSAFTQVRASRGIAPTKTAQLPSAPRERLMAATRLHRSALELISTGQAIDVLDSPAAASYAVRRVSQFVVSQQSAMPLVRNPQLQLYVPSAIPLRFPRNLLHRFLQ